MIPSTVELDPPITCRIDYWDEPDVTCPVVGWDPSWLYVLEGRVVCMVAWENVVSFEVAGTLL